jgi:RHS repeat-associated protein
VTASWKYTYDKVGNRTSQVVAGSSLTASNTTYTYNAANQLVTSSADTTTWTYDGAGNQTRNGITGLTTTYGVRLNITGMGTKTYSSFAQGNTIGLNVDGGTQLLNTPIGVSRSWTSSSDRQNYSRTADGSPVGYRDGAGQARNYYVTDHLGSVVAVFNASGATVVTYSYAPYGELRAQSSSTAAVTNDLRYTGGLKVGDLYKFGARYYDPAIGRFTQMDPSGREKNPYAYAACNPINATDPTGLVTEDCMAAGLGLVSSIVGIAASIVGLVFSLAATVPSFGASAILGIASVAGLSAGAVGTILSLRGIMNDC